MILRYFLNAPVNSPTESRAPVGAGNAPVDPPVKAGSVPAEPRYTVTKSALNGTIQESYTYRASATPRFNHGQPGLHRESIKMFNTSGMNRESPVRTGNDRLGTGTTGTAPGTTGTAPYTGTVSAFTMLAVALPGSVWAPVELRCLPVVSNATPVVPGDSRFIPEFIPVEHRYPGRYLITHRGSAGIIVRLGFNRFVTRGKFTGRRVRSKQ
ncbi:hypothetical protein DPMN_100806 [Dreissena polymorpha]|uniref:Uncharacterized protein n=1 Tax=Dreissena polymorpha TaxID=45954 RepID=A0A9D4LHR5_DREPO|nr:hypothetical protein DPMN_100806 [Dreissena polymorpha]